MATRYGSEDHYQELVNIHELVIGLVGYIESGDGLVKYNELFQKVQDLREAAVIRAALTKAERARRGRATTGSTGNDR